MNNCSLINWEILFIESILSIIVGVLFSYLAFGRKRKKQEVAK
jgi:hypothetical protein